MGQRAHEPTEKTRAFVCEHVKAGVTQERIAKAIGISDETLRKYYREELDVGTATWDVGFERSFLQRAMDPDPRFASLAIFVAKVKLGYRETVAIDPTKEKAPEALTADELRARIAERTRELRQGSDPVGPAGELGPRRSTA